MTDKELLELAAKAAEIQIIGLVDKMIVQPDHRTGGFIIRNDRGGDSCWNPLTDDGDALRLAVKLKMDIVYDFDRVMVVYGDGDAALTTEYFYDLPTPTDTYAATRRAIVRASAEIGKGMV